MSIDTQAKFYSNRKDRQSNIGKFKQNYIEQRIHDPAKSNNFYFHYFFFLRFQNNKKDESSTVLLQESINPQTKCRGLLNYIQVVNLNLAL